MRDLRGLRHRVAVPGDAGGPSHGHPGRSRRPALHLLHRPGDLGPRSRRRLHPAEAAGQMRLAVLDQGLDRPGRVGRPAGRRAPQRRPRRSRAGLAGASGLTPRASGATRSVSMAVALITLIASPARAEDFAIQPIAEPLRSAGRLHPSADAPVSSIRDNPRRYPGGAAAKRCHAPGRVLDRHDRSRQALRPEASTGPARSRCVRWDRAAPASSAQVRAGLSWRPFRDPPGQDLAPDKRDAQVIPAIRAKACPVPMPPRVHIECR